MDWFIFALASTASFAAAVLVDKFLLVSYIRNSTAYLVALIIFQQVFVVIIAAFVGAGFIYPASIYAMLAGTAQAVMYVSYLRALQVEEASRVTSLIFVYPLFVFLGSALLLGEVLAPRHYLGGVLLVASALLVSYRPGHAPNHGRPMAFSPALKHLFFFWIFAALFVIEIKYLLSFMDEWHLFIWSSIGTLVSVLPFLADNKIRAETLGFFRMNSLLLRAILLEEIFDFLGRLLSIFAFALGPVALVSAVGALQPSITLIYILALSLFLPGLIEEEIDRRTLALKFIAGFLVVIGIYLVS
ncbi:MAG TPA: EamA family transporter [Methanotrichaceae archaeon]|nr:EamA family transporter [Methanotrichaceae archaeon]